MILAIPIAWLTMDLWLQDFAYRIEVQWWVFLLAGLGAVGIPFFTVSFHSVKSALANPAQSLKSE